MTSPEIHNKLKTYLSTSKTFSLMQESEQAQYIALLENADDERVVYFMEVLQAEDKQYLEAEQRQINRAQLKKEQAETLSQDIKQSKKKIQTVKENEEANKTANMLLSIDEQLKKVSVKTTPKEVSRKKFLGLF